MDEKKRLALCMIVKDEEDFIRECIDSVKDIADEIVVIDTGSVDETARIVEELGAKVYRYEWDGSFSRARNFAISKCSAKWLLLLDADERLFEEDKAGLLKFIEGGEYDGALFTVYNYVGEGSSYNIHNALRLLKNSGLYRFRGDIHEQIERTDGGSATGRFALSGIRIHHYGYLDSVFKKKGKRERNLTLLLRELEKDPDNAFTLFNLGNEYLGLKDYGAAWRCFKKSVEFAKSHEAFCPHLYFRSAICLQNLSRYKETLDVIDRGLNIYPGCTELELLRGCIYSELRLDLLAIKSFEKAIAMGQPHPTLRFSDDCSTVKPLMALADVFFRQRDFAAAEEACVRTLSADNKAYIALYKIAQIAKARGDGAERAAKRLEAFFVDPDSPSNLVMLADIMLSRGYPDNAEKYIQKIMAAEKHKPDLLVLRAKQCFLKGEYGEAENLLKEYYEKGEGPQVLTNLNAEAALLLCCLNLIGIFRGQKEGVSEALERVPNDTQKLVLRQSEQLLKDKAQDLLGDADVPAALNFLGELLKRLLSCREFELFEKMLYNYNYIKSKKVLLHLAQIYSECGLPIQAASAVIKSIKELGEIDIAGARLLLDGLASGID